MRKTILITGASGFTGQHALVHFARKGMNVIAAGHRRTPVLANHCGEHRTLVCDFLQPQQVGQLVAQTRPDYILHLAGLNEVKRSWQLPLSYFETNVMGTLYLLDALRRLKAKHCRLLIAGSMLNFNLSNSSKPPHPYSLSKTFQTAAARSWSYLYEQPLMIVQPSNLIGPGPSNGICGLLAAKAVKVERGCTTEPFTLSSMNEKRDYLDVRDAVCAYDFILKYGEQGAVYSIGSGQLRSLGEVAAAFQSLLKCHLPLNVSGSNVKEDVKPVNLTQIKSLGWEPVIPFKQSLHDTLQYFRSK